MDYNEDNLEHYVKEIERKKLTADLDEINMLYGMMLSGKLKEGLQFRDPKVNNKYLKCLKLPKSEREGIMSELERWASDLIDKIEKLPCPPERESKPEFAVLHK
jgi:hypothetical protein